MQNRLAQGQNQNYKVFIRVRQIDYQQKMTEIAGETISIKDPTNKSSDKQTFSFTGVFDQNAQQDNVFKSVCEPMLQKLIEGHNSCMLSYGQTGSGKTFTIFGEDERYSVQQNSALLDSRKDRRGLIARALEFLFKKSSEFDEIREFVITASLAELYLDQVRDLGKGWAGEGVTSNQNNLAQNYETENLTIYENTNGQIMIKDLSQVNLKSVNNLYEFLQAAFQLREKFESKGNQVWARAHTIFTINLVQKDRENENLPFMNATIQFIDLAGSERIAKSLTEGHKFQEAILINSSLTALGKCLSAISQSTSKNIPYRESKLTRILQNCLTTSANVALIATINPSESNFEECLSTLQFSDRTKNIQLKGVQVIGQDQELVMNVGQFPGQEKLIKKLNDEMGELKSKIEFMQREHKHKLQEIQSLLGIDIDFDKIFSKSGAKDLNQFKMQKEAVAKLENVSKQNLEQNNKIEKLLRAIDDSKREDALKQERSSCTIIELKELIRKLKDQLTVGKMNSEDAMRQLNNEREQEIKRMVEKSNSLLEEKVSIIINLPQNIQTKTNENQKLQEVKRLTKSEAEKDFKTSYENLKSEYQKLLQTAKEQYEYYLKQKNEEIESFISQFKKYREKKKNVLSEIKVEMCEMYDIIQKQQRVVEKIENGAYSAGIKSFNIPSKDKPQLPTRTKLKNLFKYLDQRSLQVTRLSQQEKTQNLKQQHSKSPKMAESILHQQAQQQDLRFLENVDLSINISKLELEMIRPFCEKIRDQLQKCLVREKELKQQLEALQNINLNVDVSTVLKERDEYKMLYNNECKKYSQSRVVLESQKRFINKQISGEALAIVRPSTQSASTRYKMH